MTSPAHRYRTLSHRFSALLDEVPASDWAAPSPCAGWSALDIVNHVVTTEADLLGRMPFAPSTAVDPTDGLSAWPTVRDLVQRALDTPEHADYVYDGYFGPTSFSATIDQFYNFDLVVHTWDIARATGQRAYEAIDPREIALITTAFAGMGEAIRQPGILAPALDPGPDADPQTAFLAFLGRAAS